MILPAALPVEIPPSKRGTLDDFRANATIICDSREQLPYSFPGFRVERRGLKSGDYSVAGLEDQVALERKSGSDFLGCLASGRDRFEAELTRLRGFFYACVLIESDYERLKNPWLFRSRMNPNSVTSALAAFSAKHWRLPIFLCGDRANGQELAIKLLFHSWRYLTQEPPA